MKLVFDHIDFTIVGHLQSLLEAEGIPTELRHEGGIATAGAVPLTEVYPELWVVNNSDEARAREIIRNFRAEAEAAPAAADWTCPVCKEHVEGVFSECWNCGTAREAVS